MGSPLPTPKVSVLIPAYNCDQTIQESIDSVLNQTYQDFEIIVVDDGSTDNTRALLEGYGKRVRYFGRPASSGSRRGSRRRCFLFRRRCAGSCC